MKTFKDLKFMEHPVMAQGGMRAYIEFPNGYGCSVVTGENAYTDEAHPYEVALLYRGEIINNTVKGFLDENGVTRIMEETQRIDAEEDEK